MLAGWLLPAVTAAGAELLKETADTYDRYVLDAEARLDRRTQDAHFLWTDDLAAAQRETLQRGGVVSQPGQGKGYTEIKNGIIHDWLAATFIPGATLAKALAVAQDYPRHSEIYRPEVAECRIRSHQGGDFSIYMRIVKSKFLITDVLNTEHEVRYVQLDPRRVYSRSYSKRIAEVADPGKSSERELPVGKDRGLLWRMNGYWFFEERDGGVYVEAEEISLSRDMPFGMGKILGPILHTVPLESLRNSLEETRRAIGAPGAL